MEMNVDDKPMMGESMHITTSDDAGMLDPAAIVEQSEALMTVTAMVEPSAAAAAVMAGHTDAWYNPTATSRAAASPLRYERVKMACIEKLGMKENLNTSPLSQLVLPNVPQDFHTRNEHGLVEMTMEIVEKNIQTQMILNTWTIMVDADPANTSITNPQPPHFGYQVGLHKTGSSATKFTGHIWLPRTDPPPHVRPGRNITSFSGMQRKGTDTSMIFFYMTGQRHSAT